jgi:hypothetical protein
LCGSFQNIEGHHVIYRSAVKILENCKMIIVDLCHSCHDYLHHNKNGFELDYALKIEIYEKMCLLFDKKEFTLEEIQETLNISYNASYSLSKLMRPVKGKYAREDILNAVMGGKNPIERYKEIKGGISNGA